MFCQSAAWATTPSVNVPCPAAYSTHWGISSNTVSVCCASMMSMHSSSSSRRRRIFNTSCWLLFSHFTPYYPPTPLHYTVLKLPESSSNVILPPHFLFHIALQSLLHESTPGWCLFAYLALKAMNAKSKSLQRAQNTCCVVVSGNTESVLMLTSSDVFFKQLYTFLDQKKLLQIKLSNLCNKYMHFWRRKFGGLEKGQIKGMKVTMGIDEDGSSTTKRGRPGFLGNHLMMALSSAPDSTLPQCKASMQCTCTMAETWLHCPASK